MSPEIWIAIIAAVGSVLGVVLTNAGSARAMDAKLDKAQAVTDTKLDALTEEVRKHNDFARRVPVLEEKIKVANHRLDDLERGQKHEDH